MTSTATNGLVDVRSHICQLVEVMIHTLLYERNVYPPELFIRHRYCDILVRRSRHPELNTYITQLVQSIHSLLVPSSSHQLVIVLYHPATSTTPAIVRERCVVDLTLPSSCVLSSTAWNHIRTETHHLMATLKSTVTQTLDDTIWDGITWTVLCYTNQEYGKQKGQKDRMEDDDNNTVPSDVWTRWQPADQRTRELNQIEQPVLHPVRTMDAVMQPSPSTSTSTSTSTSATTSSSSASSSFRLSCMLEQSGDGVT